MVAEDGVMRIGSKPDVDEDEFDEPVTMYRTLQDEIKAELKKQVGKNIILPLRTRENITIEYEPVYDSTKLDFWGRRATNPKTKERNASKYASLVISGQCVGLYWKGKLLTDTSGNRITFGSNTLKEIIDPNYQGSLLGLVKMFFGTDPEMVSHSLAILAESGWTDDGSSLVESNPTNND